MSRRRRNILYWGPVRRVVVLVGAVGVTASLGGCYGHKYDPERFVEDTVEVAGQVLLVAGVFTLYFFAGAGGCRFEIDDPDGPWVSGPEDAPADTSSEGVPIVHASP